MWFFSFFNYNFLAYRGWRAALFLSMCLFYTSPTLYSLRLAGILSLPHCRSLPLHRDLPLLPELPHISTSPHCAASFQTSQFVTLEAPLDPFPSPEMLAAFSQMGDFPRASFRAGKRMGNVWGQRFWTSERKAGILFRTDFSAVCSFLNFSLLCSLSPLSS